MGKNKILTSLELRKIKVIENNEVLVDLKKECPEIKFKIASYIKINGGNQAVLDAHYARKSVAIRLNEAQSSLPRGFKLMLECAYRSPRVQQKSYTAICKKLVEKYPSWSREQIELEMDNRVSPVDIAPHCTGGAIDLTIVNTLDNELDMGTKLDEFNDKTFTGSNKISNEAKKNRDLLIKLMERAGFVNFPAEWWHWSYGDREWAYHQKNKIAIYGVVEK